MTERTILDLLDSALGRPVARRTLEHAGEFVGAIGRWRHAGAEVDFGGVDTLQMLFNISGGQRVELEGRPHPAPIRAGSVAIMDPSAITKVKVSGEADTLQIVLSRSWIGAAGPRSAAHPTLAPAERRRRVQALSARSLLVLADMTSDPRETARILTEAAALVAREAAQPTAIRGGLGFSARRRVSALLEERLVQGGTASVAEMADQAGLSLHHFIRAFRSTEGSTPHAWLTARRIDEALSHLLEDDARVDELADAGGFSSPAHFVSTFRRTLGVAPGRLRDAARLDPSRDRDEKIATS